MTAAAATLRGTSWRVIAINGQATPVGSGFEVQFRDRLFVGRFGCNSARGEYRLGGQQLLPGMVGTTEMGCDYADDEPHRVPLMTWERWGFAVLSRPMRMTWRSGRQLTLSNAAGSIELRHLP